MADKSQILTYGDKNLIQRLLRERIDYINKQIQDLEKLCANGHDVQAFLEDWKIELITCNSTLERFQSI